MVAVLSKAGTQSRAGVSRVSWPASTRHIRTAVVVATFVTGRQVESLRTGHPHRVGHRPQPAIPQVVRLPDADRPGGHIVRYGWQSAAPRRRCHRPVDPRISHGRKVSRLVLGLTRITRLAQNQDQEAAVRFSRPWLAALATMLVATGGLAACSPNPSGGASERGW